MKQALSRWSTDYGMVLVLLLLCGFFSVATYTEQSATGEAAAVQVGGLIEKRFGKNAGVIIVAREQAEDIAFADRLHRDLAAAGAQVLAVIKGEPKDAREALQKIIATGGKVDAIACTQAAAEWQVFSDLKTDFPLLGEPPLLAPPRLRWPIFLNASNLLNIANQIAVIAVIAIGMTLVIITGGIDLSVGSLIALSAVLAARFIRDDAGGLSATVVGMILASLAAILACGVIGAFSGGMITRFGIPPFIVTLAMMLVGSGLAYTLAEGQSIAEIPDSYMWLGRGADIFGLPNAVVLMVVLYLLAHVLMSRTKLGRYLYAVGGNREAARLSGVPVQRVIMFAYIASALLAGLGGVFMASLYKSGSATYGNMYELYVIAAVVVGGASLNGGEGKMWGTFIGALTIAVIQNGMNLTNVESYTQKVVLGLVILGSVWLDKIRRR
ncbi:MAG: ABC transporter permease [Pedosphaera sp.]|nr:ABC transporter permease [Pedosphaera sp.]